MIRLFIFSLLAIVLALWVTLYLGFPGDPGYLLVAFGSYTFETSLFALLVATGMVYLLVKLLVLLVQWINPLRLVQFGQRFSKERRAKARSETVEGLLYFTRGNWHSSHKLLLKSKNDSDASVINYLAAAYAAHEMGDKSWLQNLEEAELKYPSARSTINSLKAQLLFKSGQLEQCLAVLEELRKTSLNDPHLLGLLKEVCIQLQDWPRLKGLLQALEKNKVVDAGELERIQMRIFMEELYDIHGSADTGADRTTAAELTKRWKKAPARYREDEKVVKHYADLLVKVGDHENAAKAIETALSKNWSEILIARYGEQDFGISRQQLLVAENWLKTRPADGKLLLSLGRICMRNELWGKAREYYEASIKIAPSAEAFGELSRLLKHLGEAEASEQYLKNYGDLVGARLPELPMPSEKKLTH